MKNHNLAVIVTCHNRVTSTMACLKSLFNQSKSEFIKISLYLFDDGSTDGTSEMVQKEYPGAVVIKGDGGYYWNRGMRCAFAKAIEVGHDYYLLINDDTILFKNALVTLLETSRSASGNHDSPVIIAGAIRDPLTQQTTYGGIDVSKSGFQFETVEPGLKPKLCDTFNCNCLLMSKHVPILVGNLDPIFTHHWGDLDYGLRAKKKGCKTWLTSSFVGECSRNTIKHTWRDKQQAYFTRIKKVLEPKGLPPREYLVFTFRHAGKFWFYFWLIPYINLIIRRR